jgi:hypothetical protein
VNACICVFCKHLTLCDEQLLSDIHITLLPASLTISAGICQSSFDIKTYTLEVVVGHLTVVWGAGSEGPYNNSL